jgi:hypothetical protein
MSTHQPTSGAKLSASTALAAIIPQELWRWPATARAARAALGLRYRLLAYLSTQFFLANTRGGTVAKPLFFAHPGDAAAAPPDRRDGDNRWAAIVQGTLCRDATHSLCCTAIRVLNSAAL